MNFRRYATAVFCMGALMNVAHAQTCQSLVMTGHPAYPPVSWAVDGKIIGASADLVASIAKELKVETVTSVNFGSWEKAQEAIKEGRADIIFGIYKNQARAVYMNYVEPPYMLDPVSVVIRKGEAMKFSEWSDLKGRKGVTNQGESYGNKFDAYIKTDLNIARSSGVDQAFNQLLNQQADYLIIGTYPGMLEAKKLNIASKLEFLPKNVLTEDMFIAFSKKSACYASLEKDFSAALKKAVASGAINNLLDKANKQFYQ